MADTAKSKKSTSKSKDKEKEKEKDKKGDESKLTEKKKKGTKEVSISEIGSVRGGDIKKPSKLNFGLDEIESKAEDLFSVAATPFQRGEKSCIHHNQKMIYFCDSCQEPACQRCTVIGPHNNQLHRLQDLQVAFKMQSQALKSTIFSSLIPKRDQLAAQIYRIEYRVAEIKHVKTYIERDIRADYEGMLEKLRSAEGTKTVVLKHDLENIRRDIDRINEITQVYSENTRNPGEPLDFLSKYSHLKDSIMYAMSKDFKKTIDVMANDMPNDLPKKRAILEKAAHYERASALRDKIIFELAQRSSQNIEEIREEFHKRTEEETLEWSKLTDTFNQELKKFRVICFYCGSELTETSVNTVCKANKKSNYPINFGLTIETPDPTWHKTKRHFFAKPRPEIPQRVPVKDPEEEELSRSPLRDKEARLPYQAFLEVIVQKILKGCGEKGVSVESLVRNNDVENTGYISFTLLAHLLNDNCSLDHIELDRLKEVLDPLNKNSVQITEFIRVLDEIQNYE